MQSIRNVYIKRPLIPRVGVPIRVSRFTRNHTCNSELILASSHSIQLVHPDPSGAIRHVGYVWPQSLVGLIIGYPGVTPIDHSPINDELDSVRHIELKEDLTPHRHANRLATIENRK